ncbi:unannotated protein [freshwater metagenome]|uniref:Unannotated protein n=1 Tax=freshwater metagenome TaxID=449393 RepID=A0A6J7HT19_9ZZZZ
MQKIGVSDDEVGMGPNPLALLTGCVAVVCGRTYADVEFFDCGELVVRQGLSGCEVDSCCPASVGGPLAVQDGGQHWHEVAQGLA